MPQYKFDAVRWLRSRAKSARAQRNFDDEDTYLQIAKEIEILREIARSKDGLEQDQALQGE